MKYKHTDSILKTLALVIVGVLIGVTANINAQSWSNPTAAPTGNNASAPINVSSTAQGKMGAFALGKASPAAGLKLDVDGSAIISTLGVVNLIVATGTPGVGKVLGGIDSLGTVSWKTLDSVNLPAATNAILDTIQIPYPCPPKVMVTGPPETVFEPDFTGTIYGNAKDSKCNEGRLYARKNTGEVDSLHAFCQSIGYRAYMTATFYQFDSPGNNKVIKFEPSSTSESKFRFFQASASGNNHIASNVTCQRIINQPELSPAL